MSKIPIKPHIIPKTHQLIWKLTSLHLLPTEVHSSNPSTIRLFTVSLCRFIIISLYKASKWIIGIIKWKWHDFEFRGLISVPLSLFLFACWRFFFFIYINIFVLKKSSQNWGYDLTLYFFTSRTWLPRAIKHSLRSISNSKCLYIFCLVEMLRRIFMTNWLWYSNIR